MSANSSVMSWKNFLDNKVIVLYNKREKNFLRDNLSIKDIGEIKIYDCI